MAHRPNRADGPDDDEAQVDASVFEVGVTDSRRAMAYLVAPGSDDYIRIMAVLESSVTDLTPAEIAALVSTAGPPISDGLVQTRLDKLKDWTAATGRSDPSRIRRHADILARNWRWTATPAGRQVHRFYTSVLAGTPTMREIPLPSLARIVDSVERLAPALNLPQRDDALIAELIGRLFTGHDDLDTALVGAEDSLAGLADRFDLDRDATAELKGLLVDYATHVAGELERGTHRAFDVLHRWLLLGLTGIDLLTWTQALVLAGELAAAEPMKLRYQLLHVATRIIHGGRRTRLRIEPNGGCRSSTHRGCLATRWVPGHSACHRRSPVSRVLCRAATALLVALVATLIAPAGPARASAGLTVDARSAVLLADRTQVMLLGDYSCGPFTGGVPDRGVIDLEIRQFVRGVEVRAIGYLEPTRCDGAPHRYAAPLTTVAGTLRRAAATWSASGYVEGDGGLQNAFVPPTPITIR